MKIRRLGGCEDLISEREEFVSNAFGYFEPMKRVYDRSDVTAFRSLNNNTGKRVLDLLNTDKCKTVSYYLKYPPLDTQFIL